MAYPNAVTQVRGVMDTGDHISAEKPLRISDKIWTHDPNKNKGLGWFMMNGMPKTATSRKTWSHLEDPPSANWVEYIGAVEASQALTGLVFASGHGARITTGSRVWFPDIKEIIRINAAMSTDTSAGVTRNFGSGVAATSLLKPGMRGLILAPSFEEGFTTPSGLGQNMVEKSFCTTNVSWPVEVTYDNIAEANRGGNPFRRQLGKAIKAAKDQSEAELYFGAYVSDASTYTRPLLASYGLYKYITTHVYTATKLSRMDTWDILTEHAMTTTEPITLHCSQLFLNMVSMWALSKTQYTVAVTDSKGNVKDGMVVDRLVTPVGTYDFVVVDLLNQHPLLAGYVFGCPKGRFQYNYLAGNGAEYDVKYVPLPVPENHKKWGEVWGIRGWEFFEEEMYFVIEGLRFSSAA